MTLLAFDDINVIVCRDLADFTNDPWSLYQFFHDHYKKEYDNSDRLVFYTTHSIPDDLWKHLYQAANLIDVSNFFIMICHVDDISESARSQSLKWSNDPVAFQTRVVNIFPTANFGHGYLLPDTICPLPWMHLEVRNKGHIAPCCIHQGLLGNIAETNLDHAFSSQKMVLLREEFLDGKRPKGCKICWQNEDRNLISNRQRHVSLLKKDFVIKYLPEPSIASLDIKPGNVCNFKCRICSPESSSLFAQEAATVQNIKIRPSNWADDSDEVFEAILDQAPNLINIDMYGGEPFLVKNLTKLVEELVAHGHASKIKLHYNTNGSIYPANLVDLWKYFKHVDLHFSIDDIGKRFELQRGGSWAEIENNIFKMKSKIADNVKISIMPVISIMNVLYLDELIEWAESQNLPINELYLQNPPEFSIHSMPQSAKNAVIEKYQSSLHPVLKAVTESLKNTVSTDASGFITKTRYFDQIRKQDFSDSHPEISQLMGYVKNV